MDKRLFLAAIAAASLLAAGCTTTKPDTPSDPGAKRRAIDSAAA